MESLSRKRILLAITKSNWGGAQVYLATLAKAAKDAGATVSVALGSADGVGGQSGVLAATLQESEVAVLPLSRMVRDISFFREWSSLLELVRVIKEFKPDVLHLNSSKMGALGSLAGRIAGVPTIIFTAHGWPHREPRNLIWKLFVWVSSWITILLSHKVIVVSHYDFENSPVLFSKRKIVEIRNGMSSFSLLSKEVARTELSKDLPALSSKKTWLFMIAELHRNKGIDIAITSFAKVLPSHGDTALVIIGGGEERRALEQACEDLKISDSVFFLGFKKSARQYLSAANIYLMPSRKEGLPMALLEAGVAGLPVIVSNVGGIPKVIHSREVGVVVPTGNEELFSKELEYLLNNEQIRADMGAALRKRVLNDFTESEMISKTFAQY